MARKVFTYKDVEEAKKYIGKRGRFGDNLGYLQMNLNNGRYCEGVLAIADDDNTAFPFEFDGCERRSQFYSPDPEPVEKWVPFTAEDWQLLAGKWIEYDDNDGGVRTIIGQINNGGVVLGDGEWVSFEDLLKDYNFAPERTPCGKKILTESPE